MLTNATTSKQDFLQTASQKDCGVTYRGFTTIDQEMEREIAMQRFLNSGKLIYTQKSFLLRNKG